MRHACSVKYGGGAKGVSVKRKDHKEFLGEGPVSCWGGAHTRKGCAHKSTPGAHTSHGASSSPSPFRPRRSSTFRHQIDRAGHSNAARYVRTPRVPSPAAKALRWVTAFIGSRSHLRPCFFHGDTPLTSPPSPQEHHHQHRKMYVGIPMHPPTTVVQSPMSMPTGHADERCVPTYEL